MKIGYFLLLCSLCFFNLCADEAIFNKDRLCQFIDTLELQFATSYAPLEWKKESLKVNFYAQAQLAKDKVRMTPVITLKKYQQILRDLLNSTADYHVGFSFHATEYSMLPFVIEGAEGRYFIAGMKPFADPKLKKNMRIGDEIIKVNGSPVKDAMNLLKAEMTVSNPQTDEAFAQYFFSFRPRSKGMTIPKSKMALELRDAKTKKAKKISVNWDHYTEDVQDPPFVMKGLKTKTVKNSLFKPVMLSAHTALHRDMQHKMPKNLQINQGINQLEEHQSFLPRLGPVVWSAPSESPFDAYIYTNEHNQSIGYIRIRTFYPEDCYSNIQTLKTLLQKMEEETVALVIDCLNNPGGYAHYMYSITSFLIQKPLSPPKQRITITQEDVLEAMETKSFIESLNSDGFLVDSFIDAMSSEDGYDYVQENIDDMLKFANFVIKQWNKGHVLTDLIHTPMFKTIRPNQKVNYTKPLYILVNGLSISCGDFFPAMLQDEGRATIIGSRTAGAGGFIDWMQMSNVYGLGEIVYTKSLAERKNRQKIENTGVEPDVIHEMSVDDLQNQHRGFVEIINHTILQDLYPDQ